MPAFGLSLPSLECQFPFLKRGGGFPELPPVLLFRPPPHPKEPQRSSKAPPAAYLVQTCPPRSRRCC